MPLRQGPLSCPACGIELVRYDDRDKWSCPSCRGALVGAAELEVELGELGASFDDPAVKLLPGGWRTKPCARCRTEMSPINYGPFTLDRCESDHLLWFDRGELGRVRRDLAAGSDPWVQRLLRAIAALDALDEEEDLEDEGQVDDEPDDEAP